MDIDTVSPGFARIAGSDPPLDQIAHGTYFGEGPVWDRRKRRFLWVDIIGDTIYEWTPGVGKKALIHPSRTIPVLNAVGVCFSGGHTGPPWTAPLGI